jgi:hypothetical protein
MHVEVDLSIDLILKSLVKLLIPLTLLLISLLYLRVFFPRYVLDLVPLLLGFILDTLLINLLEDLKRFDQFLGTPIDCLIALTVPSYLFLSQFLVGLRLILIQVHTPTGFKIIILCEVSGHRGCLISQRVMMITLRQMIVPVHTHFKGFRKVHSQHVEFRLSNSE